MSERINYTLLAPRGMKALGEIYAYVRRRGLSDVLVELVWLRVSQIGGSAYCIDLHTRELLSKGLKVEKLALVPVWREAGQLFDERERAALAWAETVSRVAETGISGKDLEAARAAFDKELDDLTIAICLMNAFDRIVVGLRPRQATLFSISERSQRQLDSRQIVGN